ncbi:M1 family metallopeptidase [Chitinophaga qingshengii]|uniref:M1 family metallopeptidase n=1 Tax=Chitinophaga qingshengii TaxID=1569794 RepID=A0ABR7TUR8_9BACT|nr:M1 family metallopeptidase [Chitinophaga qingshengii]MBC9934235.1 M1 family metallopeptidase [Chitinophaga qingshengii]
MKKCINLLLLLVTAAVTVQAQQLYEPRNIRNAFENGTRSRTGDPGPRYWQNKGRYDIHVTVNPPSPVVYGRENITYINNSPNVLKNLVLDLICNDHKPQSPRSGYVSKDYLASGVVIDTLIINGQTVPYNNDRGTVGAVKLPSPLASKDSLQMQISWHYELSVESGREGIIDSTTYFMAYYYPRVAVYDDYNGWNMLEHTGRVEFYNDFNDYRVAVKVPKNFVVWGTGNLLNAGEVLQPEYAARLKKSYSSDSCMHIATKAEMLAGKVTQQQEWNTWKFSYDHIPDVALGLSNHYVWDAGSAVVDSTTRRRASMQAAYNDTAYDFRHSVRFGQTALSLFSHQWPGVAYPYPVMTAFQGYADMEYPMMVNDGSVGQELDFAQLLQDHEMAHTYFPFYMGINESRYAFMDEGWATTFEYLAGIVEKGKEKADDFYRQFRVAHYIGNPSTEEDQPIITMSNQVSGDGYSVNSYGKASLSYLALKDLLGDKLFRKCLHAYMDKWHGKHPIPWDYFNSFSTAAGQDLNWFWQNWYFSNHYIDLKLSGVTQKGKTVALSIANEGGFAIPFDVVITYVDGSKATVHQTPAVWKKNQRQLQLTLPANKVVAGVTLEGNLFMDATPGNNSWASKH